jgi:hypothetical protein
VPAEQAERRRERERQRDAHPGRQPAVRHEDPVLGVRVNTASGSNTTSGNAAFGYGGSDTFTACYDATGNRTCDTTN